MTFAVGIHIGTLSGILQLASVKETLIGKLLRWIILLIDDPGNVHIHNERGIMISERIGKFSALQFTGIARQIVVDVSAVVVAPDLLLFHVGGKNLIQLRRRIGYADTAAEYDTD